MNQKQRRVHALTRQIERLDRASIRLTRLSNRYAWVRLLVFVGFGSLALGLSYFYAEVKRLRALLTTLEADSGPVLYLIDEIFRGTNNHERLLGSRAYIRAVTQYRGVGVLSTHDLELVHLADEIPRIHNYHFTETIADGRMRFDYELRAGPCPTTNALAIMRMEGLPVDGIP